MNNPAIDKIDYDVERIQKNVMQLFFSGKFNREEMADNLDRLRQIRQSAYGSLIDMNTLDEEIRAIQTAAV